MGELKLLNPAYPLSKRTLRESIYSGFKILTGPYGFTYLKHFPEAHAIAKERFGIGTFQYHALISAYLEHCARFTHYAGQTQSLKAKLMENQVAYEPWQLYSWKSLQESPIQGVSVMVEEPETSLYDQIKMQLANGYEFVGTRFEALAHFVEPYLKEGLAELREIKRPNIQHFLDVEVRAYLQAHLKKPEILGAIDFSEVETHIRQSIRDQIQYLSEMSNLLKYVSHGELLDEHAH